MPLGAPLYFDQASSRFRDALIAMAPAISSGTGIVPVGCFSSSAGMSGGGSPARKRGRPAAIDGAPCLLGGSPAFDPRPRFRLSEGEPPPEYRAICVLFHPGVRRWTGVRIEAVASCSTSRVGYSVAKLVLPDPPWQQILARYFPRDRSALAERDRPRKMTAVAESGSAASRSVARSDAAHAGRSSGAWAPRVCPPGPLGHSRLHPGL
jgi:hypothetical protein